jgi:hypothetical protein
MPRRADRDWAGVDFRDFAPQRPEWAPLTSERRLDGGWVLGQDIRLVVDDPEVEHLVDLIITVDEGRLVAHSVAVRRRDHRSRPVDGDALRRLPIASYVVQAILRVPPDLLTIPARMTPTDAGGLDYSPLREHDQESVLADVHQAQVRRRGTAGTLAQVARLYREALRHRDPAIQGAPTQYVADQLPCSRGYASRLVTACRKSGELGPARRNRAGEQQATDPTPDKEHQP